MAVKIRLKRTGTRNASCFRVVVMDKRMARDGRAIEEIGFYNPRAKEERVDLAQIIDRIRKGVVLKDIVKPVKPSKKQQEKMRQEAEAKAAAEAAAAEAAAPAEA